MNIEQVLRIEKASVLRPILYRIGWIAAGFLAANAALMSGVFPFAIVLLCIFYNQNRTFYFLAAGTLIGSIFIDTSIYGLGAYTLPLVLIIPVLKYFALRNVDKMLWRQIAILIVYVVTSLVVPMLQYDLLMQLFCGVSAIALCAIGQKVYTLCITLKNRRVIESDELIALNLIICAFLAAIPDFNIWIFNINTIAGLLYIGFASRFFGAGAGAGCGMALGGILLLRGGSPSVALIYGIGGMLAGVFKNWKRLGILIGFLLGDFVISIIFTKQPVFLINPINVALGFLPIMLMKKKYLKRLLTLSGNISGISDTTAVYMEQLYNEQSNKLQMASSMFSELSRVYVENSGGDINSLKITLTGMVSKEVCSKCEKYEYCWTNRYGDTYTEMRLAANNVLKAGEIKELPVTLSARCCQQMAVITSLNKINKKLMLTKPEPLQKGLTMAAECKSVSNLLYNLAQSTKHLPKYDHEIEKNVFAHLDKKGIGVSQVVCQRVRGDLVKITIKKNICRGTKDCVKRLSNELCEALGTRFVCVSNQCGENSCFSQFFSQPRLAVNAFGARKRKDGQRVCGDSYSLVQLNDGRYIVAISDGAGSGENAARESEGSLALLETLYQGNMEISDIYSTINELLLLRSKEDGYSTMDVVEIDLDEGLAKWTKIGAVPGYILREGKAEKIEASALPIGIIKNINPAVVKRILQKDDILVLVSDGVFDALCGKQDKISDLLTNINTTDPELITNSLLESAVSAYNGIPLDDMTVVTAKII